MTDEIRPRMDQGGFQRFVTLTQTQLKRHALLVISCLLFFITSIVVYVTLDIPFGFSAWSYLEMIFLIILPITFLGSLVAIFFYMALIKKPESLVQALIEFYKPYVFNGNRWAKAIPAIAIMMFGFMAFTEMKAIIPVINPYGWDVTFMKLDRMVHFGQDPWLILQPVFGYSLPTLFLNFVYNIWFFVMFGFWLSSGWTHSDNGWERQFLLSFLWCWIIGGTILATVLSSMGPAFYDLVDTSINPYAAQMDFLNQVDERYGLFALGAQDMLRESYLNPLGGGLSGISAMPSLHNATSTLFMLTAYRMNKKFGHLMLFFLICILIGSVHLAWHYAVDAYLGIVIALLIWKLSGVALQWQDAFFRDRRGA